MYKKYLTSPCALSMEEAVIIFSTILKQVEERKDEVLTELYEDLLHACVRYAKFRSDWALWSKEEKAEQDASRTSAHNRVIDTHTILYRYMFQIDADISWYEMLGYTDADKMTRKRLGDFACYVALLLGLDSR